MMKTERKNLEKQTRGFKGQSGKYLPEEHEILSRQTELYNYRVMVTIEF